MNSRKLDSKKLYIALEKANIIFYNSEKAAEFVNLNYDKIHIWWRNKFTQKAKNAFCKKFANKSENSVSDLTKLLKKICN